MSPWTVLIIIILIILVVWWALLRNSKTYKADFPVHHDESHAEEGSAEQSFGEAATQGMDGHSQGEVHDVAGGLPHKEAGMASLATESPAADARSGATAGDTASDPLHSAYAVPSETRFEEQASASEPGPVTGDYTSADLVRDDTPVDLGEAGGKKSAVIEKGTPDLAEPAPVTETPVEKFETDKDVSGTNAPREPSAEAQPDNLIIIEGIGPKVNQLLQSAGIFTFAQLAETDVEHLRAILAPAGLRYMDPTSWPEQARLARDGKMEELKTMQDHLQGGRNV